ncbi:MAG TPA: mechanosensitive ion channel protein MscS, partial [Cyanobacteria bacterium UBA11049]|nr:mechanosensitive ion channel protein MscS [Cyanobacteria bacterium UBA11049]
MRSRTKAIALVKPLKKMVVPITCGILASIVLNTSAIAQTQGKPVSIPGLESLPLPGMNLSFVSNFEQLFNPNSSSGNANNEPVTTWITLDGRNLFQIAASSREDLSKRVEDIQPRLQTISQKHFQSGSQEVEVKVQRQFVTNQQGLQVTYPDIYVNGQRLLTVTDLDAKVQGENDPQDVARKLRQSLEQDLKIAKQERQPPYLLRQGAVASGVFFSVIICSWGVRRWQKRLQSRTTISTATVSPTDSVTTQLTQQQHQNLQEARQRLFQAAQALIWGGGTLVILSLFPYTRIIPVWILTVLFKVPAIRIPSLVGIVTLGTYVAIRLSYVLIDRFTTALANNSLLGVQDSYVRLQLRVMTISAVTKGIATFGGVGIGILFALSTLGVNLAPVLAGAGLIGVGISLAAQSLIKDAINGFLIIVEDQYAVGDVINVGDVGGMVENLNLRITQVRDGEGRLITIPNSEIKTVANLSSRWSRVDLQIPIAYDTDIDRAMNLIDTIGLEMDRDPKWQEP